MVNKNADWAHLVIVHLAHDSVRLVELILLNLGITNLFAHESLCRIDSVGLVDSNPLNCFLAH